MKSGNEKFSYTLRIVAGIYLCYLSYGILSSVVKGDTEGHSLFVIIAAIAFIAVGVALVVTSLLNIKKAGVFSEEDAQEPEEEPQQIAEEEDVAQIVENEECAQSASEEEVSEQEQVQDSDGSI